MCPKSGINVRLRGKPRRKAYMSKILTVDDDKELTNALKLYLTSLGQLVEVCDNGEDALQLLSSFDYDVIILDWSLPGISGHDVCKTFRERGGQTPIIFLTGKEHVSFLETALDSGADDYMVKPFEVRELFARIKTLLRRRSGTYVPELKIGNLTLKPESNLLITTSSEIRLRVKETALLEYLMRHPNRTFNAQQLLNAVWPSDSEGTTNSVRTWMNLLRRKLESIGQTDLIKTISGSGYMIEDKEA
ncbi:MAG: response regulator transcription factor [Candidatus Melainabacteria bacterium]|nr:MAG: response regulator transcription factor [Candidatus Melainabacteria bacterium]